MHTRSFVVASTLLLVALACRDDTTAPTPETATSVPTEASVTSNTWIIRANMPITAMAAATVTNSAGQSIVYAMGGGSQVAAYNVATNTWSAKASLPGGGRGRTNGVAVINGKIYISGGFRPGTSGGRPELYRYNPATNIWVRKHDMPGNNFDGMTGVINGKLYVLTQCQGTICTTWGVAFYRYDPITDRWSTLPNPPSDHISGMAGVIGGKFYAVGGDPAWFGTNSRQLDVYDPVTNRWTTRARMPSGRWAGAAAVLGTKLYVIGGRQISPANGFVEPTRTLYLYNSATNSWVSKAPMPVAKFWIGATRVVRDGQARIEVVGRELPNNLQYIP